VGRPFNNKVIGRITFYLQQPSKYFIRSVAPSIKQLRSKYVSSCLHAHTLPLQLLAKLLSLRNNISLHYLTKRPSSLLCI